MTNQSSSQTRPMSRFDWERVIRRADLPLATKGAALILASYADDKGRKVHPGEERLSRVAGIASRNIRRHVSRLRDLGLITRVSRANRLRGLADEYRLTVPLDVTPLGLLDVDEATRGEPVDNPAQGIPASGEQAHNAGHKHPVDSEVRDTSPDAGDTTTGYTESFSPDTGIRPPTMHQPFINPEESSSQESTSPGATAEPVDDEESPARRAPRAADPEECAGGHGGRPGRKTDGQPWCAQCRAETRWRTA